MCQHRKVTINEEAVSYLSYSRENDGTWSNQAHNSHLTGSVYVYCDNCGLQKKYTRNNRPLWLRNRIADAHQYSK